MPADRRARKRLATRQSISNVATRLFLARGFDQVTVDEIAASADVGRMTVFNHFPRKEDLFFDRDEEGRAALCAAVREREAGIAPVEALRRLAQRLVSERSPWLAFNADSEAFVAAIQRSESLKARARAIRDEIAAELSVALAASVGRPTDDADAQLAANLLLASWTVALVQAHDSFREHRDSAAASAVFLSRVDCGSRAVNAALAGTPYV